MSLRLSAALLVALTSPVLTAQQPAPATAPAAAPAAARPKPGKLPADSMELGRKWAKWLLTAQKDSLWAALDSTSKVQVGSPDRFEEMSAQFAERAGEEQELLVEKFVTRNGMRQYYREGKYSAFTAEPVVLRLVMTKDGKLAGFGFNPKSKVPPLDPEP